MNILLKVIAIFLISMNVQAFTESYYADKFCNSIGGISEYVLQDRTRVDCLTDVYTVEVDFAKKWYEAVGQSLHYATVTGKKPAVALIIKNQKDCKYMARMKRLFVCPEIRIYELGEICKA